MSVFWTVGVLAFFGWKGVDAYLKHQRQVMDMKLRMSYTGDHQVIAELQALRQQMAELRDTTTRYDMSFDAALQRVESRVGGVEQRLTAIEQESANMPINSSVR